MPKRLWTLEDKIAQMKVRRVKRIANARRKSILMRSAPQKNAMLKARLKWIAENAWPSTTCHCGTCVKCRRRVYMRAWRKKQRKLEQAYSDLAIYYSKTA